MVKFTAGKCHHWITARGNFLYVHIRVKKPCHLSYTLIASLSSVVFRNQGSGVRSRHLSSRGIPCRHPGLQLRGAGQVRLWQDSPGEQPPGVWVGGLLGQHRLRQRLLGKLRRRSGKSDGEEGVTGADELTQQQMWTQGMGCFFFVTFIYLSRFSTSKQLHINVYGSAWTARIKLTEAQISKGSLTLHIAHSIQW